MTDLNDPIEKIFEKVKSGDSEPALELIKEEFKGDIDLKTDLNSKEMVLITCLESENELIKEDLPDFNLYSIYLNHFKRFKVSLDRKSRIELVQSIQHDTTDRTINKLSNLNSLTESRK